MSSYGIVGESNIIGRPREPLRPMTRRVARLPLRPSAHPHDGEITAHFDGAERYTIQMIPEGGPNSDRVATLDFHRLTS